MGVRQIIEKLILGYLNTISMDSSSNISSLIESKLAELSSNQSQVTTAYDYEKTFADWWTALGKEVLQARLNEEQPTGQAKKNS